MNMDDAVREIGELTCDQQLALARGGAVERYVGLFINGPLAMACGAEVAVTSVDQKCPNSGNCAAGHRECWVMKVGT